MRYSSQVARRALGVVLIGLLSFACAPDVPLTPQPVGPEAPQQVGPPLVLPTNTVSFRLAPPPAPTPVPTDTPMPPAAARPSPSVWIGGEGCLTALGPEGWQTFELSGIVRDIAVDAHGTAILAPGLRACNGRLLRDLLPPAPGGEQDAVAIDPLGRIWVGHYGGIAVLEGGRWRLIPIPGPNASTRARTVHDLAIDSRGVVWVATGEGLASYDGHIWRQYLESPGPGAVAVACLLVDGHDSIWLAHEKGLSVLRGESWEHFALETIGFVRELAADAAGRLMVGGPYRGISVLDGGLWRPFAAEGSGPADERISALAADALGRVWVGTRHGLSVYDGERWIHYQEANSGLGDDRVSALAVGSQALAALPAVGPTRYGALSGQVTMHRRPVPGVRVVLCCELSVGEEFADTPCQGSRFQRITQTGVDGRYLFEQVPLGHYAVAAEIEPGHWVTEMRVLSARRYQVREGQTTVADPIEGGE